ncbi:MAG: Na/Pi cotransporter family protein [Prevotella histicola]|jgi:Na/Pi-cotransporter II-like protein|uniref:Na/Pi cotransporter family protein n=1 Tax=Prevotella histicola TaxID=470565 RepID=A0A930I095_9BACT|nr:Na/Pi cotransporter family protein [Prevotella histicola]MBF1391187.1 Na/Pi cotransporter family protein [Prevotella histicola]MBF1394887.1 Na/Pi cotransporter family protein [Prevotella histicola]MBF1415450.1 Na/Pi cotransporter family protein [Prevotella histicola]MBW4712712.1 Na/Pi cotransporter family protein [Prevotella histicola]MBW4739898.1 Na/Pi cotransporter family protein [Prevotella histicola]
MTTSDYLIVFMKILGSLALLIYGMKVMSEALQKMAGSQLRHILGAMTTNRFTGMLTGTFITCAVQSSSATTVMTVSFVNAGLLTLAQAISVIMGANIGTTLTAWIMSLGFNVDLTLVVFPAFFLGIILIYSKRRRYVGDFLFGIAFLFFALVLLSSAGKALDLEHNPAAIEFFKSFDTSSHLTIIIFLLIGTLITCIVQSSAAVMAITILLCSTGVLPIYLGIALVMGENIGTTATVNLAALGANTQARRAAFAHLLFNVFGVVWLLCLFYPFVDMVCRMVGYDPENTTLSAAQKATILPIVLAMFHTCFNVCNTAVLIWFIPQMERVVCWIIKAKANKEDDEFRLRFIQAGIMKTPELSVLEASKEIHAYAEFTQHMFGMVRDLLTIKEDDAFEQLFDRIDKYEDRSDDMEVEIAKYLDQVSDAHLSDDTKEKVRQMLREISEIESIGDSCLHIARTIGRRRAAKEEFTEAQLDNINQMFELVDDALTQMGAVLVKHKNEVNVDRSFTMENQINNYRSQLRTQNITDVNDHKYTYTIGTMYMDIIQECERLGDFIINVVQARMCMK